LLTLLLLAVVAGTVYLTWTDLRDVRSDGGDRQPTAKLSRGGRLTGTLRAEPRSFNRLASATAVTDLITNLTQSKLIRVNRTTRELEPWLAEKWEAAPDGRSFVITLRRGLEWSDGRPFTADDVRFTVAAVFDPRAHSVLVSSMQVNGQPIVATVVNDRTVRLDFPAPFGPGLRLLDNLPILPRHKLESAVESGAMAQTWNSTTPPADVVGLGPFALARYEPGQRLVFTRNPKYWRKASDGSTLPYLDEVVLEIVPDQSTELLRLQAGQSDLMQQPLRSEDLAALRPQIDAGAVSLIELGVSTDPDVFFLNLRDKFWVSDPRKDWITRRELRQAISHAVDREAFAESVFLGAAVPVWGPVTPGNVDWFSPNVRRYPYSLDQSKALLAGIGLVNRDGDEWLEDPQGHEARFSVLTYRGNQVMEREAAFVRDALQHVGVRLDLVPLEQNALVDRMLKGTFESIYFGYNQTDLDPALNMDYWLSSGGAHLWNMAQATPATAWEAEIDELMVRQSVTTDRDERRRLFADAQRIFGEEVPALYFAAPRLYMGVSARTLNLSPSVLRPQLLWSPDNIAVRPERGR
jgi:peptide/nickel transport system substrate-binding protein